MDLTAELAKKNFGEWDRVGVGGGGDFSFLAVQMLARVSD